MPLGSEAAEGTYVRYPWHDMVALLRLEATRAGAYIVGEDLGTVEDHVRDVLSDSGVLSYSLFWFEDKRPSEWPYQALGAVTTHDLPTIVGVWTGCDIAAQRNAGLAVNEQSCVELKRRLSDWTGSDDNRPLPEVIEATYSALGEAPVCPPCRRPGRRHLCRGAPQHAGYDRRMAQLVPGAPLAAGRGGGERVGRRNSPKLEWSGDCVSWEMSLADLPVRPPVAPMLAKLARELPSGDYIYEPKWDGFRCIVFRSGTEVELGSRNELPLTRYFPELVRALSEVLPERAVLDGEVVIAGPSGLDFDALSQRVHPAESRVRLLAEKTPASFIAFDLLALDDRDLRQEPFHERRRLLEERNWRGRPIRRTST